jgi:aryl-alcohol dehydrogenase-like predicted oxidoreductase
MKYVRLGNTGVSVSRICLGCGTYGDKQWYPWILDEGESRPHFARAIEAGINFFDTANRYSAGVSESITGRWLSEMGKRDELVIASKVYGRIAEGPNMAGLSRKHIIQNCEASLRRLRTDYIDLYYMHRWDFTTPIEETVSALDYLINSGKVRYLGASSMAAWQFSKAIYTAREFGHRFDAMQNLYNLAYREEEREMIPLCMDQGVAVVPYNTLAQGFLSGNRERDGKANTPRAARDDSAAAWYSRDEDFDVVDAVKKVAGELGVTTSQAALAWALQAPGVTSVIFGTSKVEHIDEAIRTLDVKLSAEQVAAMEAPYKPRAIIGHEQPQARRMLRRG